MGPLPTPGFFPFSPPEPADFPTAVFCWACSAKHSYTPLGRAPRSPSCSPCPCSCPTSPAWVMGPTIVESSPASHSLSRRAQAPLFLLTPEELRVVASVLPTRKKLNKLKMGDFFSDPSENRGLRVKCLPGTWRVTARSAHLQPKSWKL